MWIASATSRLAMTGILFLFVIDSCLNCKIFVKKLNFLRESSKFKKNQSKFFIQLQCVIFKNPRFLALNFIEL